jgi:histidyl-tRNA synthetase
VHAGEGTATSAWAAAEQLRDQGFKVLLHLGGGSFKSQMKRADASGARFAVIVGEDEANRGVVSIKPLRQPGEQVQAQVGEAAGLMRAAT